MPISLVVITIKIQRWDFMSGQVGTSPPVCHLWNSNPYRGLEVVSPPKIKKQ